jgi:hypothetical protein
MASAPWNDFLLRPPSPVKWAHPISVQAAMTATTGFRRRRPIPGRPPAFFEEHAGLLGEVKLSSPLTGRAVSLQERQMEVMRDKYNALELRMADLMRHGRGKRRHRQPLPRLDPGAAASTRYRRRRCRAPWSRPEEQLHRAASHAAPVEPRPSTPAWFAAASPTTCACSPTACARRTAARTSDFEAVRWLDDASGVRSTVLLPLRAAPARAFGLLVLGSPDPERFSAADGDRFPGPHRRNRQHRAGPAARLSLTWT